MTGTLLVDSTFTDTGVSASARILAGDVDRAPAVGRHAVRLHHRPAAGQDVGRPHRRRGGVRIGQQHIHREEAAGRPFREEPVQRRRRHAGAVVPALERLAPRVEVHRALDDDRHAVGRRDLRRHVGRPQGLVFLIDPDGEAAAGADGVGLDDRRARRLQVADADVGRGAAGVQDQVEQVEVPVRRALGEVPARRGLLDGGLHVCGISISIGARPAHEAIEHDHRVRFQRRRERGAVQRRDRGGVDRGPRPRRHRDVVPGGAAGGVDERQQDARRARLRVGDGEAGGEEAVADALGQVALERAARMRAGRLLGGVGPAVRIGIPGGAVGARGGVGVEAVQRLPLVGQAVAVAVGRGARRVGEGAGERRRLAARQRDADVARAGGAGRRHGRDARAADDDHAGRRGAANRHRRARREVGPRQRHAPCRPRRDRTPARRPTASARSARCR